MCSDCAYRPELVHCSQCRAPLYGQDRTVRLTRNRALEELACYTFPPSQGEASLGRGRALGRGRRTISVTSQIWYLFSAWTASSV